MGVVKTSGGVVVFSRGQMITSDRSFAKPLRFSKTPLASRSVSNAAIGYLAPFPPKGKFG